MDKQQIENLVLENFKSIGNVQIHVDDDGVVNVSGGIQMRNKHIHEIPVQFGTVTGRFEVTSMNITTLKGCPRVVMGTFSCAGCDLTSLEGGPEQVHGFYACNYNRLTNLVGLATQVGRQLDVTHNPLRSLDGLTAGVNNIIVNYDANLPLLRLLDLPGGFQIPHLDQAPWDRSEHPWEQILAPHAGEGKPGAIKAAAELIRAGYKGNARW